MILSFREDPGLSENTVVTRFAPSPTGYLHVGGARTALFNWVFARHMGGRFLLRIEDTDLKRNTPTAMQQVLSDLRWLGIDWDEGPEIGGPHGPYLQSQRLEIYHSYADRLLREGKAYYCFDTSEELDAMRAKAEAAKQGFFYPRPAVFPDDKDVARARAEGRPVAIRFAVDAPHGFVVDDIIRGKVKFGPAEVGDFIIIKSDGFPTYHFGVVIDDELMKVTHVIRGQEHLMNTPCHQALQDALGFRRPAYAHMSVTVSEGGGKLSKRERAKTLRTAIEKNASVDRAALAAAGGISPQDLDAFLSGDSTPDLPVVEAMAKQLGIELPEINIVDFFRSGYIPETMVNFLGLLGFNPGGDREIMRREELVASFDIHRLTKSNSLFDRKKLSSFNTEHIKICSPDILLAHFKAWLAQTDSPLRAADDVMLARMLQVCLGARTLVEIERKCRFVFVPDDAIEFDPAAVDKVLRKDGGAALLPQVAQRLAAMTEVTAEAVEHTLRTLAEENKVGLGKVAQPLRVALTGITISPPIFDAVDMLGMDRTLKRIALAVRKFGTEING
jgi:glutamyl/glutaminyl-tRNA synthetase